MATTCTRPGPSAYTVANSWPAGAAPEDRLFSSRVPTTSRTRPGTSCTRTRTAVPGLLPWTPMDDPMVSMTVDTGCRRSVAGTTWHADMQAALVARGLGWSHRRLARRPHVPGLHLPRRLRWYFGSPGRSLCRRRGLPRRPEPEGPLGDWGLPRLGSQHLQHRTYNDTGHPLFGVTDFPEVTHIPQEC